MSTSPKVGRPSLRAEKMPMIKALIRVGRSRSEIATELEIKLPTLCRWLTDEGIVMPRIDRNPDRSANFGATAEERSATGRRGGQTSSKTLVSVYCAYSSCGRKFAQQRTIEGRASRQKFCSREHAYAARSEGSGKTTKYTCDHCGASFTGWTNVPRRFCSREHYFLGRQQVPRFGFNGRILDSAYEAAFVGLCSVRGIPFDFFDRADVVAGYGPDFVVQVGGTSVHIDTKGVVYDDRGWALFRQQRGQLAIVSQKDLDQLFQLPSKGRVLAYLLALAEAQALA